MVEASEHHPALQRIPGSSLSSFACTWSREALLCYQSVVLIRFHSGGGGGGGKQQTQSVLVLYPPPIEPIHSLPILSTSFQTLLVPNQMLQKYIFSVLTTFASQGNTSQSSAILSLMMIITQTVRIGLLKERKNALLQLAFHTVTWCWCVKQAVSDTDDDVDGGYTLFYYATRECCKLSFLRMLTTMVVVVVVMVK